MTFIEIVVIGLGGFIGAVLRYFISLKFQKGTLIVNLIGSFLIGCVFGLELPRVWTFFLASGLAGALTTFSTMNKELIQLWQSSEKRKAFLYIASIYGGGILIAWIGYSVSLN
ncbi:fluoride efflux transporter FluC [Sporosarcina sp. CAU 1771]